MQAFLAWLLAMGDGDGEYEKLVPSFSVYEVLVARRPEDRCFIVD